MHVGDIIKLKLGHHAAFSGKTDLAPAKDNFHFHHGRWVDMPYALWILMAPLPVLLGSKFKLNISLFKNEMLNGFKQF